MCFAFPTHSERGLTFVVPKKKKNMNSNIFYSGHICFTSFNSVAFLCLCKDLWHFTLSPSDNVDKLTELCIEALMRLSAKCHRTPNSLLVKHHFEEKYANVLTEKDPLSM